VENCFEGRPFSQKIVWSGDNSFLMGFNDKEGKGGKLAKFRVDKRLFEAVNELEREL